MWCVLRSRPLTFATLTIAMVIGACTTGAAITSAPAPMPVGVPAPVNASFAGGTGGYDSGAQVFDFSTQLPPAEATRAYAATLVAAGYEAVGTEGAWRYFLGATTLIAFEVGASGPPTDLLVRVMTRDARVLQDLDPIAGNAGAGGRTPAPWTTQSGRADGPSGGAGADLPIQTPVPQPDPPHGSPNPGKGNGNPNPGGSPNPGKGNGNPNPGGSPNPGKGNGNPNPGGSPNPGNGNPNPGGSPNPGNGNPNPGNGNPNPGGSPNPGNGNPNPGNGNPNPGGSPNPGNGNPNPGNGNPNPGGSPNPGNGNPNPGNHGH
jgi:hypothetical protein